MLATCRILQRLLDEQRSRADLWKQRALELGAKPSEGKLGGLGEAGIAATPAAAAGKGGEEPES